MCHWARICHLQDHCWNFHTSQWLCFDDFGRFWPVRYLCHQTGPSGHWQRPLCSFPASQCELELLRWLEEKPHFHLPGGMRDRQKVKRNLFTQDRYSDMFILRVITGLPLLSYLVQSSGSLSLFGLRGIYPLLTHMTRGCCHGDYWWQLLEIGFHWYCCQHSQWWCKSKCPGNEPVPHRRCCNVDPPTRCKWPLDWNSPAFHFWWCTVVQACKTQQSSADRLEHDIYISGSSRLSRRTHPPATWEERRHMKTSKM